MARWVAGRAAVALAEKNPIQTRRTDEQHLRDRSTHQDALRYREQKLLSSLAQRLRGRLSSGIDAQTAILECQTHLITTACAHVERTVYEAFARRIEAEGATLSTGLAASLGRLQALFGLSLLERHRGWYLEQDYFEDAKAKAIRAQVDRLCDELRPVAVALADGLHVPDELLRAPIATL